MHTNKMELGAVKIHKNVIASISSIAALEIEGVTRIGKSSPACGIIELFGFKSIGVIKVEFNKNGEIRLVVPLVIKYGCHIPDLAEKVQDNIRHALEKMLDKSPRDIHISILGVEKGS